MQLPIVPGRPVVIRIRVYGEKGVREMDALLDTGAAFVTISPRSAAQLGYDLQGAPRVPVATANGVVDAPQILLSRVSFGEFGEADVPALCVDVSPAGVGALLGLSLLGRFNITLDAKVRMLTITDP